jgi:hypothetical protein
VAGGEVMMFTDEFLASTEPLKAYACDPHKHSYCNKSGCVFNLDIPHYERVCDCTLHAEFKWDGVSERMGHYGKSGILSNG